MVPISLILADDHPIVLNGLEALFQQQEDFRIVDRCLTGTATLEAVRKQRPDILILDIRMPGMDGLAVLRKMAEEKLPTRVVLLTAVLDEDQALEAFRLGVAGIILKEAAPQTLVQCIRQVHAGERWLDQRSLTRALEKLMRREAGTSELASALTPREMEILRMVVRGLRNKEIGEKLFITEGTVKIHLHNIYEKLQVGSRVELVLYAQARGII